VDDYSGSAMSVAMTTIVLVPILKALTGVLARGPDERYPSHARRLPEDSDFPWSQLNLREGLGRQINGAEGKSYEIQMPSAINA
jgi:hypothetical protein